MAKFREYKEFNLSQINKDVLAEWDKNDIFRKSLDERAGARAFVFYEGPPSANGMPGIHHVIARSIKDIFCRYKTMKGFLVNRKAGWDTHGLPVELSVEKALGITKEDIGKKISIEDYNAACRKDVMRYTKEWEELTRKMGYWVDMNAPYITYDNRYIETLWWLLKQLYNKNLLYKGYTIQPYSPAAGTGLSSHELNQPGCYRDVKDTTCVAQFKINGDEIENINKILNINASTNTYFLAWTTTPWTLSSNTALAVGPEIDYVAVQTFNPYTGAPMYAILSEILLYAHFNKKAENADFDSYKQGDKLVPFKVLGKCKGKELAGIKYEQLIPWVNPGEGAFKVLLGDFVTTEDGTGIVHVAPTFGADDDRVAKANNVPPLMLIDKAGNRRPMVDLTGKYFLLEDLDNDFVKNNVNSELYSEFAGRFVKNAYDPNLTEDDMSLDLELSLMLKQQNLVFKIEKQVHNYPHCWRTDKPILYYPLDSWFIKSTAARERMIELNNTINWKPESTGTGRFGKWLENLQDWNLSRSRYWGTPLPVWRTEDKSEEKCIGSMEEFIAEIEKSVKAGFIDKNPFDGFKPGDYSEENYNKIDLHRPYVDNIVLVSDSGQKMYREIDLIDVWFDSGAMPYAQAHYPFENKDALDAGEIFPADFIAEGVDQTRGWFFTLHAIATMVFDNVSFKNVVSNGLVLDKNGNKMSKRLGNAIDPFEVIEEYGSDVLRWYMITNASPWDNLKFNIEGMDEAKRKFFSTLYNTYSFFALYANVDNFDNTAPLVPVEERPEIDRWIISLLNTLIEEVDRNYDNYEPTKAGRLIQDFVNDNLSNWYVRLNRKRFWGGDKGSKDKIAAYQTLYYCLETVAKLSAPIMPFYSDVLFRDLVTASGNCRCESVHLSLFPQCDSSLVNKNLEEKMSLAQQLSSMVLALRRKVNIKVRQPLAKMQAPVLDNAIKEQIEAVKQLILNEVNVKELEFIKDTAGVLVKKVKPNFKVLGAKFGKQMKEISAAIATLTQNDINKFEREGKYALNLQSGEAELLVSDVEILLEDIPGQLVASEGSLTVALDVNITEELRREGVARELVNRIQNIRKDLDFDVTDKINVTIEQNPDVELALADFKDYIAGQTLALNIELADNPADAVEVEMDKTTLKIAVKRIENK
ncbi:MAG: isoleucine--tRNA ligase [Prevotellaceae bacterium]|jgi:isoleucyl-tRNA synthetase|nr:isoleucine--tRNA ligase [Prevotellaceae bacterium]